jgi:hypothetical protein
VDCHDSYALNSGSGGVDILDLPKIYSPGQRISLRVSAHQQHQQRWGFQITALDGNAQAAGQFSITDAVNTQMMTGNNRFYVEHTTQGTQLGTPDSAQWTFDWIAPDTDVGPVTFYVAGNAADGSFSPAGDYIYTNVAQIGGPSDPIVTLIAPNGGEVLHAGDTFNISWSSKNATAHDLLVQFNGNGDVPKSIVQGLAGDIQQYQWTVPNVATTHARVIVVAEGKAGRSDSDSSKSDFTIVANSQPNGPIITSVNVTNQHIKASGSGFLDGLMITVNDVGFVSAAKIKQAGAVAVQKGKADDGSAIGKLIPSGAQVRLKFTNPDGGATEFDYTRP